MLPFRNAKPATLLYHTKAFANFDETPYVSKVSVEEIASWEKENNLTLPASVKEWFSLWQATNRLDKLIFLGSSHTIKQLTPAKNFDEPDTPLLLHNDNVVLDLMSENEGIAYYGICLDGSEDPPVVIAGGKYDEDEWRIYTQSFSDFILRRSIRFADGYWSKSAKNITDVTLEAEEFTQECLSYLTTNYQHAPQSNGYPGFDNYLFYSKEAENFCTIEIWTMDEDGSQTEWKIATDKPATFSHVVEPLIELGLATGDYVDGSDEGITLWEEMLSNHKGAK